VLDYEVIKVNKVIKILCYDFFQLFIYENDEQFVHILFKFQLKFNKFTIKSYLFKILKI